MEGMRGGTGDLVRSHLPVVDDEELEEGHDRRPKVVEVAVRVEQLRRVAAGRVDAPLVRVAVVDGAAEDEDADLGAKIETRLRRD